MRLRPSLLVAVALLPLATARCGDVPEAGTLRVAVSVLPQAWLVERIGGPHVEVVTLVGPGESPATYQPSDAQVTALMRARVYFRIGVAFEDGPWWDALGAAAALRVVDLRTGLALRELAAHAHAHGDEHDHHGHGAHDTGMDPHTWLSPECLRIQAQTVADVLAAVDPAHAEDYRQNLSHVLADLDETDAWIRDHLAPHAGGRVYVFHPAWGYFCDAYDLEQVAIEIEGKEPSEAELTDLVARAKEDGIRVIFVQRQIRGPSAPALAAAIGAEVRYLDPLAKDVLGNLREVARAFAASLR